VTRRLGTQRGVLQSMGRHDNRMLCYEMTTGTGSNLTLEKELRFYSSYKESGERAIEHAQSESQLNEAKVVLKVNWRQQLKA